MLYASANAVIALCVHIFCVIEHVTLLCITIKSYVMTTVVPIQNQDTAVTSTTTSAAATATSAATSTTASTTESATTAAVGAQIDWTAVGYVVDGGGNDSGDTVLMVSRRSSVKRSKLQRYACIYVDVYAVCCVLPLLCKVLSYLSSAFMRTLPHTFSTHSNVCVSIVSTIVYK
jgi:hypothetical protein